MEEVLKSFGISETTIKEMKELCPDITNLNKEEILEKIEILKKLNCDKIQVRNIISSNSIYLDRLNTDIIKLIKKLQEKGIITLNILLEENPYILNLDDFEIENYIQKREKNGEKLEEIVEDMTSNPLIFNEI